ncbi:MAG TPA: hypothetical protein VHX86_19315 [Tepidisphaeraceae bacterium]|jgi:hypothetical protein|nr:hypothetical protein [Tepidisphaeraceae bacterium]
MTCEATRQILLDLGIDESRRHDGYLALQHLENCQSCQIALREYDGISKAIDSSADVTAPRDGWMQFEHTLGAKALRPEHRWNFPRTLAMAASLLLAIATFEIGRHFAVSHDMADAVQSPGAGFTQSTRFAPHELPMDVSAFEQVSKVFDGRASWVLVSGDASDIGVAPGPIAPPRQVLLLRLTTSLGSQMVSDADLMILPGQTADLKVPFGKGQLLHYKIGASEREPTRLSIWLEVVTLRGGEALGALSTTLDVQPGQKFTAGQLVTSAGAYQLKVGFAQGDLRAAHP